MLIFKDNNLSEMTSLQSIKNEKEIKKLKVQIAKVPVSALECDSELAKMFRH